MSTRWLHRATCCRAALDCALGRRHHRLTYSTAHSHSPDHVETHHIPCGSAGSVSVHLHNIHLLSQKTPLLIYLPPFAPSCPNIPPELPSYLPRLPTATISYRWVPSESPVTQLTPISSWLGTSPLTTPLYWPNPVHDVSFAYSWLRRNLGPSRARDPQRQETRDVFVFGSHLGASLAASLAISESRTLSRFSVRGFIAINGIYDWTAFLPGHRANRATTAMPRQGIAVQTSTPEPSHTHTDTEENEEINTSDPMWQLGEQVPGLFHQPSNMFDPFASPTLFFRTAGIYVPRSFNAAIVDDDSIDNAKLAKGTYPLLSPSLLIPRRRAGLIFPPRASNLKIPYTLLLYDPNQEASPQRHRQRALGTGQQYNTGDASYRAPLHNSHMQRVRQYRQRIRAAQLEAATISSSTSPATSASAKASLTLLHRLSLSPSLYNSYESQALELATVMRASIERMEISPHRSAQLTPYMAAWSAAEPGRRIRALEVDQDLSSRNGTVGRDLMTAWISKIPPRSWSSY